MSNRPYFSPYCAPPEKMASGETNRLFVRNTVDVANQLLDAIEKDISDSKEAISARDSYKNSIERENSLLQQQLMEARGEIGRLHRDMEQMQRQHTARERQSEVELEEYKQSCQSEMDRVLHQVRVKEQHLLRAADQSSSSRARCGQLAQQVDQLLREREEMNEEFARLHEEKQIMFEKLTTGERYASTLELACSEMKARLQSMQQQLSAAPIVASSEESIAYEREKEREKEKYIARHFRTDPVAERDNHFQFRASTGLDPAKYQRYQESVRARADELIGTSRRQVDEHAANLVTTDTSSSSHHQYSHLDANRQYYDHDVRNNDRDDPRQDFITNNTLSPNSNRYSSGGTVNRSRPPPRPPVSSSSTLS